MASNSLGKQCSKDASEHQSNVKPAAADTFTNSMYDQLRGLARKMAGSARQPDVLQPTALSNEAYLKLAGHATWKTRAHFQAIAAQAIRQVLIDQARANRRLKRGGNARRLTLDTSILGETNNSIDALAIDDALRRLESEDARAGRIVELRFFGDMPMKDVAEYLNISLRTAERDWRFARAWLHQALCDDQSDIQES